MAEQQLEVRKDWRPRTGPPKKDRVAVQFTVTMNPELYDRLVEFMQDRNFSNRSGTISKLVETAINSSSLPYT